MDLEIDSRYLIALGVVGVIFLLIILSKSSLETTELCFNAPTGESNSKCIQVEIADESKSHAAGLSLRDSLDADNGMLFVFETPGKRAFWMRRMEFPLDIIWVDENKSVTQVTPNIPICVKMPCKGYAPKNDTLYVVEVNAGFAEQYDITNESMVFFKLPEPA